METIECFKYSSECWFPSYSLENSKEYDSLVRVRFSKLFPYKEYKTEWRVSVWGDDDLGMERDFPEDQKNKAMEYFYEIVKLKDVTRAILLFMGFRQA